MNTILGEQKGVKLKFQDMNFSYLVNYVRSKKFNDQVQLSGEDFGQNNVLSFLQGIAGASSSTPLYA